MRDDHGFGREAKRFHGADATERPAANTALSVAAILPTPDHPEAYVGATCISGRPFQVKQSVDLTSDAARAHLASELSRYCSASAELAVRGHPLLASVETERRSPDAGRMNVVCADHSDFRRPIDAATLAEAKSVAQHVRSVQGVEENPANVAISEAMTLSKFAAIEAEGLCKTKMETGNLPAEPIAYRPGRSR